MTITSFFGSIELGLIFAIMSLGLFIAFRILDLPDLTVDGSFVTGVAVTSILTVAGHPILGLLLSIVAGMCCGLFTALLHNKLKVHAILAGILTMTALYSINLKIMQGKPSIFLYDYQTIFTIFKFNIYVSDYDISKIIILLILAILITILLYFFFQTMLGLSLIATGDNPDMVASSSINIEKTKSLGFAICNGLVALAGGLYAQYSQSGVTSSGNGMLVLALASIIIGEVIVGKRSLLNHLIAVVIGAILYRLLLTFVFTLGLDASDIKLFSSTIVIIAIAIPVIKNKLKEGKHAIH